MKISCTVYSPLIDQSIEWLQGYVEISQEDMLTVEQVKIIRDHLKQVFQKKTPDYSRLSPFKEVKPVLMPNKSESNIIC